MSYMLAVKPTAGGGGEEELAAVGVGPSVGHGQQPGYLSRDVM